MKKILFMLIDMNIGGTEKALITMLSEIPKDRYEVTVLMLRKYGEFLNYIPKWVKIEFIEKYEEVNEVINISPKNIIIKNIKLNKYIRAFNISSYYLISKLFNRRDIYYKGMLKDIYNRTTKYDVAVAYAGPMDFISYYIANKIDAKKKLQWIHFDINKIGFDKRFSKRIYKKFDKIFCVSQEGKDKLIDVIPSLKNKTEVFLNIISDSLIEKQANNGKRFNDNYNGLRLLTVGRLCDQKGQDLAIEVTKRLIKDGFNIRWYCVGEGIRRNEYEELITKLNLEKHFILLGSTSNPYGYIDDCDIYVQPSRHEGYCTTVTEAKILNKPMVITDVNGSREQIIDGYNGIIVDINIDEIYDGIKTLINNGEIREKFVYNLRKKNIDTKTQIENLIKIIEN